MKKSWILLIFLVFCASFAFSDNHKTYKNDYPITLEAINCIINGRSRSERILSIAEINKNESWQNIEDMELWIKKKKQVLTNWRELDSIEFSYKLLEFKKTYQAFIIIKIVDSNNIIVFPEPEYSSTSGLDLSLRGRDYNFLGLLTPLEVNIGYVLEQEALTNGDLLNAGWYLEFYTSIPFKINKTEWEYSIEQGFSYTTDNVFQSLTENDLYCLIETDIGNFSAGLTEACHYNSSNNEKYHNEYGQYLLGWFFDTSIEASYNKDIINLYKLETSINLELDLSFNIKNLPDFSFIGKERAGPELSPSFNISMGQINWLDNLRDGFLANIEGSFLYNFYYSEFRPIYNFEMTFHHSFFTYMGISTNLFAMYRPNTVLTDAESYLRGVYDLEASSGVFFNFDLPFLISIEPDILFNWSWAEVLSFDLHIAPFIDLATTYSIEDPDYNLYKPFYFCTGIEAVIYPEIFRSVFLRISLGFNPLDSLNPYEIYIGLTHQY